MKWADQWLPNEEGPPVRLRHKTCNKPLRPSAICAECRKEVRAEDFSINPLSAKEPAPEDSAQVPVLERILQDLDAALLEAQDALKHRGVVRVAALPSFAAGRLPDAIKQFREAHPGVSFVLKDVIASRVLALIGSEEADLGFTGGDTRFSHIETLFSVTT